MEKLLSNKMGEKRFIIFFVIIALLSGWIGLFVDMILPDQGVDETLGMGIWLVLPFLCGIILRVYRKDWKDFGVKPSFKGNIRWYVFAILVFPVITLFYALIAYILGLASFSTVSMSNIIPIISSLFFAMIIKNIFEDFAWQGYLTPKLVKTKISDFKIYLIVGLVWAFWHAPYYLFFLPDAFYSTPFARIIDTFIKSPIVITIWAIVFVEITRITGSVWPAVLMHAVEDAIPNYLVFEERIIEFSGIGGILFNPLTGILPLATFVFIGLWLRKKRIERDNKA